MENHPWYSMINLKIPMCFFQMVGLQAAKCKGASFSVSNCTRRIGELCIQRPFHWVWYFKASSPTLFEELPSILSCQWVLLVHVILAPWRLYPNHRPILIHEFGTYSGLVQILQFWWHVWCFKPLLSTVWAIVQHFALSCCGFPFA